MSTVEVEVPPVQPLADGVAGFSPADLAPSFRFPGGEAVGAAAAALLHLAPVLPARAREHDGRRFSLVVGPGAVQLRAQDDARSELTRRRRDDSRASEAGLAMVRYGVELEARDRDRAGLVDAFGGEGVESARRSRVTEWSRKSRANMTKSLAQLDYSPMVALMAAGRLPAMITLTYPGEWLSVAADGREVKRHLRALCERYVRAWDERLMALWKLEFQERGAPHFHLWGCPPQGLAKCGRKCDDACRRDRKRRHLSFRAWLAVTWVDVVAHADPVVRVDMLSVHAHRKTVDFQEGARYLDPRRLAVYFAKHGGAAGGKEYQHVVPEAWSEPGRGPGRFWGYWGLEKCLAAAEVDVDPFVVIKRTMRRYADGRPSPAKCERHGWRRHVCPDRQARSRVVTVERVDRATGVVRKRRASRRAGYMRGGGLVGGFLTVNDGPGFVMDLARHPQLPSSAWSSVTGSRSNGPAWARSEVGELLSQVNSQAAIAAAPAAVVTVLGEQLELVATGP